MESERLFGDKMPNFDICGTVFKELFKDIDVKDIDVLDVDAKTETAASSESTGRKSTENEQLEVFQVMNIPFVLVFPSDARA